MPLRIAGIIQDELYFKREIAPRLDGDHVQFIGPVRAEDRSAFLGGATALLHLIDFDEPFGFSVVEAMACGTPVIAFDRGSMSEIIRDGTTGFIVADVAAACEAVERVGALDRQTVRAEAVRRFDSSRMVDEYVDAYTRAIADRRDR
jgi:glycosyltransferase involved in cell wall biosynthesis